MTADTEAARGLVARFFALLEADDRDGVAGLFAETVAFCVQGPKALLPWVGERHSRAEVRAFLDELTGQVETVDFRLDRLVADGAHVVALGRLEDRIKATGRAYASAYAIHFEVRGGAIVRYFMFDDSFAAAEAGKRG